MDQVAQKQADLAKLLHGNEPRGGPRKERSGRRGVARTPRMARTAS
jgi:hypothetical protein